MKLPFSMLVLMIAVSHFEISGEALSATTSENHADSGFAKGADLSMLQYIESHGVQYREDGQPKDALAIFKDHGCNYVRLRLFLQPNGTEGQVNTLDYTLKLARRIKQSGLRLLLDFHYSDGWADPTQQNMPKAWKGLSHKELVQRVYTYTRDTLAAFAKEGCVPDMVQVGNEVTNGMLWPDGGPFKATWGKDPLKVTGPDGVPANEETGFDNLADLLKAGIRAVRESAPANQIKIMIHVDQGGNQGISKWFFDNCRKRNLAFDMIGLSYYPIWHGSMQDLGNNLKFLAETYHKDIIVVETGYDTRGGPQGKLPFPLTAAGQKSFLEALILLVAATPDGFGKGVFYWAPEWIMGTKWNGPQWSGQWEDRALFDHSGNMLPALNVYHLNPSTMLDMHKHQEAKP
jgi:arabinogalactan endo-1,4-beta-galactosidase